MYSQGNFYTTKEFQELVDTVGKTNDFINGVIILPDGSKLYTQPPPKENTWFDIFRKKTPSFVINIDENTTLHSADYNDYSNSTKDVECEIVQDEVIALPYSNRI